MPLGVGLVGSPGILVPKPALVWDAGAWATTIRDGSGTLLAGPDTGTAVQTWSPSTVGAGATAFDFNPVNYGGATIKLEGVPNAAASATLPAVHCGAATLLRSSALMTFGRRCAVLAYRIASIVPYTTTTLANRSLLCYGGGSTEDGLFWDATESQRLCGVLHPADGADAGSLGNPLYVAVMQIDATQCYARLTKTLRSMTGATVTTSGTKLWVGGHGNEYFTQGYFGKSSRADFWFHELILFPQDTLLSVDQIRLVTNALQRKWG